MKIGIARFSHESITFLPGLTKLEDFKRDSHLGEEVTEFYRDTDTNMGGFIDVCDREGVELFPVCDTFGGAREPVADEVYDFYVGLMKKEFGRVASELDGILLALQGDIVTESMEETESHIVRDIREVVGHDMPIMISMDLHANIAPALLDWATLICAEHCSPHIDKKKTGQRTARLMLRTLRGEIRPAVALSKPGIVSVYSDTFNPPGSELVARREYWEKRPSVLDVSIFFGFAHADTPQAGMTFVAITDDEPELAQDIVKDLTEAAWKIKGQLGRGPRLPSVKEGVALAIQKAKTASKPIMIAHPANRTTDVTYVLQELLAQGAQDAAFVPMRDPESATKCIEVGIGNTVDLEIGAKTGFRDGGPVKVRAKVLWAGQASYIGRGERSKQIGATVTRKDQYVVSGPTAIVKVDGVWIQISAYKCQLSDEVAFTTFGYKPRDFKIIATAHAPEAYSDLVGQTIVVDAPGQTVKDLSSYEWKNVPPGTYPINSEKPFAKIVIRRNP